MKAKEYTAQSSKSFIFNARANSAKLSNFEEYFFLPSIALISMYGLTDGAARIFKNYLLEQVTLWDWNPRQSERDSAHVRR